MIASLIVSDDAVLEVERDLTAIAFFRWTIATRAGCDHGDDVASVQECWQ